MVRLLINLSFYFAFTIGLSCFAAEKLPKDDIQKSLYPLQCGEYEVAGPADLIKSEYKMILSKGTLSQTQLFLTPDMKSKFTKSLPLQAWWKVKVLIQKIVQPYEVHGDLMGAPDLLPPSAYDLIRPYVKLVKANPCQKPTEQK
jgi:hypothetical protein